MFRVALLPALVQAWQYHCPAGMDVADLQYDLRNKTFLVTGADGRLGFQVSLAAARSGARVLASCRTQEKAEATKQKLDAALNGTGSVEPVAMDLGSFASVRQAAASVSGPVDSLIHVAGAAFQDNVTADGFAGTVQINVLSPALLTKLLLPQLRAASRPRVVYIGSANEYDDMHFPDNGTAETVMKWSRGDEPMAVNSYSFSKLLDVHLAKEEALRHRELTVFSVTPGFFRDPPSAYPCPPMIEFRPCPQSPAQGATSTFFAAAQPGIENVSGAMFDFETTHAADDYFNITQSGETCIPRPLPRWDDGERAKWYDAVQASFEEVLFV